MKYPDIRTLQGLLHLTNLEKSCFEARFQHGPSIKTSQEIGEKYSLYPHVWSNHAEIPTFFKCPYTLVHHPSSSTGSFEGLPPKKKKLFGGFPKIAGPSNHPSLRGFSIKFTIHLGYPYGKPHWITINQGTAPRWAFPAPGFGASWDLRLRPPQRPGGPAPTAGAAYEEKKRSWGYLGKEWERWNSWGKNLDLERPGIWWEDDEKMNASQGVLAQKM